MLASVREQESMTFRTAAAVVAAGLCLSALPLAGRAAECTDGRCRCFGEDDCAALFDSGQCQMGSEVKGTTEALSLCTLQTKKTTLGHCQQIATGRDLLIVSGDGEELVALPHVAKDCGG